MNMTFIGIIILVILAILGFFLSRRYRTAGTVALYILGLAFLAVSIYLFPASSWRFFAIFALAIGIVMIVISTVIVIKKHTRNMK